MGDDLGGKAAIVTGCARGVRAARRPRHQRRNRPLASLLENFARALARDAGRQPDEASYITGHVLNVNGGFGAAGVIFEPEMIFEPEEAE
jgi:NAD(P)-dependent dehydrogenase (short-subunit alcohol dehydrogenase family)